jgi:S-methylmethionine-dependent homocysteine/selenocysteine methylase
MTYRDHLPQLDGDLFLTDGGIETVLIFHEGLDLPAFAAFDLLKDAEGEQALRAYYEPYAALAAERGLGFVLESPTWRASPRWAGEIGYGSGGLDALNRRAIALMEELRSAHAEDGAPIVISGCVGPQDDGYSPAAQLSADAARNYHLTQIATFADTAADMVCALTLTYADEAVGIARAAADHGMPSAISFTVETDGRLPSGQPLGEAVEEVDQETGGAPAYYMVNCAHPAHFENALAVGDPWLERVRGVRANASRRSHAELDEATELDEGDPADLAAGYVELGAKLPSLNVLGGCCGTDHRHVGAIRDAWLQR